MGVRNSTGEGQSSHAPAPIESARAKPLKRSSPLSLPLVPARMVNEVLYCERLMYLEWVQREWDSNQFTADGSRIHKRVDSSKRKLRPQDEATLAPSNAPEPPYQARSVWLTSERLGLTAKLDVVDVADGKAMAVEFKRGKRPNVPEGAYLPERAQLCAQVLLLREHGYECEAAEIYFAGDHQRTPIAITEELLQTTVDAIARVRELAESDELPAPLVDSPKCPHCSLNTICLPDETNYLRAKHLPLSESLSESLVDEPDETFGAGDELAKTTEELAESLGEGDDPAESDSRAQGVQTSGPRPLVPGRDDKVPVYVSTQGASIRLDGHRLLVVVNGEKQAEARLPHTSHISLYGNVQISTQALRSLLGRGIPVHFFTYGGWWSGACVGADSNNVQLRLRQYHAAEDAEQCLMLARRWVHSKIANSRTLLRRNHHAAPAVVLNELRFLAQKALKAESAESLLGIEGTAARTYFGEFAGMLTETSLAAGYSWEGRNRRPPRDRLNALLSFAYSLLTKEVLSACRTAGLDPLLGFYHRPQFGRPSLALDLMEEFRPIIADSTVLLAINNGTVQYDDFDEAAGSVALDERARRRFIQTYEKRLHQEVTHPVFGYKVSYRRVLELQTRLLTRLLLGEITEYPIFRVR